jgi:hypothetical protein
MNWLFHHPSAGSVDTTGLTPWRSHYGPPPSPGPLSSINPQPLPPSPDAVIQTAARHLTGLAALLQLATTFQDKEAGRSLAAEIELAIARFLDDYCGAAPLAFRFGWPFPGPWVMNVAAELASLASSQSGAFRDSLLQIASQIAERTTVASRAGAANAQ